MYTQLLYLVLLFAYVDCKAQQKVLSHIPVESKNYTDFIPVGYGVLTQGIAIGDLNNDGMEDMALALCDTVLEQHDTDPKRPLIVLLKTTAGYKLLDKCENAILCKGCGGVHGDPFAGMDIIKGVLIIRHFGGSSWRWEYTHKFKFRNDDLYLIGKTSYNYWLNAECEKLNDYEGDFEDINLVTGERMRKEINHDCKLIINKKDKIKVPALLRMNDFDIDSIIEK